MEPSLDIVDLARSLRLDDAFGASAWLHEAARCAFDWRSIPAPCGLTVDEAALVAGLVELMAHRAGVAPPDWTRAIGAAGRPIFIPRCLEHMPRARARAERFGPEPLRRRGIFVIEGALSIA